MSSPLPAGIPGGPAYYAAANGTARYMGEPVAVVVAESRYVAEDAAELVDVEYEPLPVEQVEVHERHFAYGAVEEAFAAADVVVEGRFEFPRWSCTPVECYGVVADWRGDGLTAWANFQGPFTLHGVAAAALGIPAAKLRLLTPSDSGGSFGIKSSVYVYVVLLGARLARARRAGPLDRGSPRAPGGECPRDGTRDPPRGGVRGRWRAARPALRRARGRRGVCPRAGAGDALPHARFAVRRLPRAQHRGAQPGRGDQPLPDGSQSGVRRPAAVPPARANDGHRGGSPRTRSGGAAAAQPRDRLPVHDRERCRLRRRRLSRLPRAGARARPLRRAAGRAGRGPAARTRHRVRRRAVDLEHGLHHACADAGRARSDPPQVGQRRGLHPHRRPARRHLGPHLLDAAGSGTSHRGRSDRGRSARRHARRRHRHRRDGHVDERLVRVVRGVLVPLQRRRRARPSPLQPIA